MLGTSRVVACVLASALIAGPAFAQHGPAPAPSDKDKQRAGDLVKQAITKSQAGDHEAAVKLYLDAYAIVPLAVLLSNVGSEYQQASKPVESLRYFCMYLKEEPTGSNATYATAQAKVLQIQLGNRVDDDKKVCEPIAPPPPVETVTDPHVGEIGPGVVAHPAAGAGDPGKGWKTTGLVTAGVGVVGLGLGVVFGIKAKTISDDISNQKQTEMWRKDIKDYEARGQRDENYQVAGLIVGGALVVAGGVIYWHGRSKTSSAERVVITPTVSPTTAGLAVGGAF